MEKLPYERIPDHPDRIAAGTVLGRMIDGLAFRFRWATEGLAGADFEFRASPDSRSVDELVRHVWGLSHWMRRSLTGREEDRPETPGERRLAVLEILGELRGLFAAMSGEELGRARIEGNPFWCFINGPIADALTHTGQINTLRRLAGNPPPEANVFMGRPPEPGDARPAPAGPIRRATYADRDALIALDPELEESGRRRERVLRGLGAGRLRVAVEDTRLVGYVAFDYSFFDRGFIEHLRVRPDFRRRGLGSALMRDAADACDSADLFTSTNESNRPMQALLAKLGYEHCGVVERLDPGDPEWFYVLRRRGA